MAPNTFRTLKVLAALALAFFTLLPLFGVANASPLRPQPQLVPPPAQMGGGGQNKLAPDVQAALKLMPPGDMLTVIVTLSDQVSPNQLAAASPPGANRAARLKNVIERLQARANVSQRGLKALLNQRRAAGRVGQVEYLWIVNGIAVTATPDVIQELATRPEVQSITANATIQAAPAPAPSELDVQAIARLNLENINAPELWRMGYTGQGIVVGSLDTGVDIAYHRDLAAAWRGGANSWYDPYGQNPTPNDYNGHGTWTMGVMVGGEKNGVAYGVAPGAQWIAAKIFNNSGQATVLGIHRALQWLIDPDGDPNTPDAPHVVTNSWVWAERCNEEFRTAVQNLRAAGILPIFAAGNNPTVSYSPANYPESFAVGAVGNTDLIYVDSSRGPSDCDGTTYPEIVAPGIDIYTTDLFGTYYNTTGTSVAAPHVAGALALMLSAAPWLTVDEQEAALLNGVVDLGAPGPDNAFGHGRLDILSSLASLGDLDLSVQGAANANTVLVNKPFQLTLHITNHGPNEASAVTFSHTISPAVTLGSVVSSQGGCSQPGPNSITCAIGAMLDTETVTVSLTFTPTTSGITLTNTSIITTAETDFNVVNNKVVTYYAVLEEAPFELFLPLILK